MSLRNPGVRLRGALVMRGLVQRGIQADWFNPDNSHAYHTVVVAFRYDPQSLQLLRGLRARGCRVVLDLCENHFLFTPHENEEEARILRELAQIADAIVVCSASLAEVVRQECPFVKAVAIIGDLPDDLSIVPDTFSAYASAWRSRTRAAVRFFWARHRKIAQLIWFGDSGTPRLRNVGMPDMADQIPALERVHRDHPVHLTVVSNSSTKYRLMFSRARFPCSYEPWNPRSFDALLSRSDIALIPTSINAYTRCKSDNRLAAALRAGVAVVAAPLPSYQRYADVAQLGDIEEGLRRYLTDPVLKQQHATAGKLLAAGWSSQNIVCDLWEAVLLGDARASS